MNTKISKKNVNLTFFFLLLTIVQVIMNRSIAVADNTLESLCSYIVMLLGFGIFFGSYFFIPEINFKDFFLFLFLLYLFWIYMENSGREQLIAVLEFSLMLTVWRSSKIIMLSENAYKVLLFVEIIQGIIFILLSFSGVAYKPYVEYTSVSEELTLGFPNPNQTGIILFSVIVILSLLVRSIYSEKRLRFLVYIEIIYLFVLLIRTDARTSILSCVVFMIFYFFNIANVLKRRHPVIVAILSIVSLPFVFIYNLLSEKYSQENIMIFGKKLFSGRQRVYHNVLENWSNRAFGNLSDFCFQNSHNASLTILANIGIVGFIMYAIYIIAELLELYQSCYRKAAFYPFLAILCLFIMGCAETAVLTSGTVYFVNLLILVTICRNYAQKYTEGNER